MPDIVELISVSEQDEADEAIFAAWETGKGLRALAREFGLSPMQVEQALDRMLPAFDASHQLRAFKRELRRLEDLCGEFFTIAKRDRCRDSAHLVARLNERICAMRGWSAFNIRMDLTAVEASQEKQGFDKIKEVIWRIGHPDRPMPEDWGNKLNGPEGADGDGDGKPSN